ncbi:MAG: hypothetical protein ABSD63_05060 [Candidatus Korobacteraceae bacterium]
MIETTVVEIISNTTVVLGAGSGAGVREGMLFVLYELGPEIFDPQNSAPLGKLEIVKGKVSVIHVQEKLAIAQTLEKTVSKTRILNDPIRSILTGKEEITETYTQEKLSIESSSSDRMKDFSQKRVLKIGDRARQVGY